MHLFGPQHVIDMTNPLSKSLQGKYFLGETGMVPLGGGKFAWAALVNPAHSGTNLFLDIFTVSNLSDAVMTAHIWFCLNVPGSGQLSAHVTPANLAVLPQPLPRGQIVSESTAGPQMDGKRATTRLVPSNSTVAAEKYGHWILGPDKAVVLTLKGSGNDSGEANVSFGWWEEPLHSY
ncbi:DUF6143 family protein [Paenibacillus sp. MBLB4367]|uniref:DUF6143 family protein n=1 Tax=Paenibacillus sp. MBLB4367 TaxID=3384767 RepID=UPI003907FA74